MNDNKSDATISNKSLKTISVVIPSYNRCPYDIHEFYKNPLIWCLNSLVTQKNSNLKKIIIIDDDSSDYTTNNVRFFTKHFAANTEIKYIKNKSKLGANIARNIGLSYVDTDLVFFMDDDCILNENSLAGIQLIRNELEKYHNVGAIHIPVFLRNNDFDNDTEIDRIGKLYESEGMIFSNFRSFPKEYRHTPVFMKKSPYLAPIPIDFFHEVFIIDTNLIKLVNGFVGDIGLRYVFSEGLFLSVKLRKYNVEHFQIVDPSIFAIHFRYGNSYITTQTNNLKYNTFIGDREITLGYMIQQSSIKRENSGARTNLINLVRECISGRYALFLKLNKCGAEKWLRRAYNALIYEEDDLGIYKFPHLSLNSNQKEILYRDAVQEGVEIYKNELQELL